MAGVCIEGELADHQKRTPCIRECEVHPASPVTKNPERNYPLCEVLCTSFIIGWSYTQVKQEPLVDFSHDSVVYRHRRRRDPAGDSPHQERKRSPR